MVGDIGYCKGRFGRLFHIFLRTYKLERDLKLYKSNNIANMLVFICYYTYHTFLKHKFTIKIYLFSHYIHYIKTLNLKKKLS